jgi:hypothetical protein
MESTMTHRVAAADFLLIRRPSDIDALPWKPVPDCPGVAARDLWRSGDRHDTLISYERGASTPGTHHARAHHHIWVIAGDASIAGQPMVAGSYVYVPPGTAHPITAGDTEGCLLLQMHRPMPAETTR